MAKLTVDARIRLSIVFFTGVLFSLTLSYNETFDKADVGFMEILPCNLIYFS